jgi:hypothetical protein
MFKVKIEVLEMPTPEEMKTLSEHRKQEILKEEEFRRVTMKNKALADLPNFIRFVNERIENNANKGLKCVNFSFDDESFGLRDPRCEYRFKGEFDYSLAEKISQIYTEIGYECECRHICCTNGMCYRTGTLYISW